MVEDFKTSNDMSKVILAENARLYFTICVKQLMVRMIPTEVFIERLRVLKSVISHATPLYKIIDEILSEFDSMPEKDRGDESKLAEKHEVVDAIAHKEGGMLELLHLVDIKGMRIGDNDTFPSVPHIHEQDSNRKLDIYTGYFTDGTHLPKKDLVDLWNDKAFIQKLSKNRPAVTTKRQ